MVEMTLIEIMRQIDERNNPNFIFAEADKIKEAIKKGQITQIEEKKKKRKNDNAYYQINNDSNSVLMHVKEGKCVIMDKIVKHENKSINLVDILGKYSFRIKDFGDKRNRERVICNVDKASLGVTQMTLERMIISIALHGCVANITSDKKQVHHKEFVWNNKISKLEYLTGEEHREKGNKSHMKGLHL